MKLNDQAKVRRRVDLNNPAVREATEIPAPPRPWGDEEQLTLSSGVSLHERPNEWVGTDIVVTTPSGNSFASRGDFSFDEKSDMVWVMNDSSDVLSNEAVTAEGNTLYKFQVDTGANSFRHVSVLMSPDAEVLESSQTPKEFLRGGIKGFANVPSRVLKENPEPVLSARYVEDPEYKSAGKLIVQLDENLVHEHPSILNPTWMKATSG